MKSVYLAGPISGVSYDGCTDWREMARMHLAQYGIDGRSPMRAKEFIKDRYGDGKLPIAGGSAFDGNALSTNKGITTRDRFDCTTSDVVLFNFLGADRVSVGSCIEIGWASGCNKPIVMAMESGASPASPERLSWLAALIDGEGSVYLTRRPRKGGFSFDLRIHVDMTDLEMIQEAHRSSGNIGTVTGPYSHKSHPHHREHWRWRVSNQQAANLLSDLYPYMIVKRDQAAIGVEIENINRTFRPEGHKGKVGTQPRPTELVERQQELYDLWATAQTGKRVNFSAPKRISNPHHHGIVLECAGFIVPTLEEALDIAISILK